MCMCVYTHMYTYSDLHHYHFSFFPQEDSLLFQAPTVNFLRRRLNLPSICPHHWDHWDGGLEAKHPKPHSQSKTMSPFPSLLISSRSYVKPNKVVTWSHSWALQPPCCAMPWHAVLPCHGWQALGNLWDMMVIAMHVKSVLQWVGLLWETPGISVPALSPLSAAPGVQAGSSIPAHLHDGTHGVWRTSGTACVPCTAGPLRSQKCRNTSLRKSSTLWWHNKLSRTILCFIFP